MRHIAVAGLGALTFALALPSLPLSDGIVAYRDEGGRVVYVNSTDTELSSAAHRGGVAAAVKLMEKRKSQIPGIEEHLEKVAARHEVDSKLVHALIEVESAWNPRAVSRKGALGLMQLMPETARELGVRNALDAGDNIRGGVKHLRRLLDKYDGNLTLTLAAYNAGETAVANYGGVPPYRETIDYVSRVRTIYERLSADIPDEPRGIYPSVGSDGRIVYVND